MEKYKNKINFIDHTRRIPKYDAQINLIYNLLFFWFFVFCFSMDDYDIFMNSSDTESTYSDYFETKDFKRLVPAENFKGGSNIMRYSAILYGLLTFMCLGDAI